MPGYTWPRDEDLTPEQRYQKYGLFHIDEEELWRRTGDDWPWGNNDVGVE